MLKLLVLLTVWGSTNAIAPVWAESMNIRFTGVVEERVSVDVSEQQAASVEIAANSSENIQIPHTSYRRTLSINSTQPVSVQVTSVQGEHNTESRETVVGKAELKLPSGSKNPSSTVSQNLIITVVPH